MIHDIQDLNMIHKCCIYGSKIAINITNIYSDPRWMDHIVTVYTCTDCVDEYIGYINTTHIDYIQMLNIMHDTMIYKQTITWYCPTCIHMCIHDIHIPYTTINIIWISIYCNANIRSMLLIWIENTFSIIQIISILGYSFHAFFPKEILKSYLKPHDISW